MISGMTQHTLTARVKAQTTQMLHTMHGQLSGTVRAMAGQSYLAKRPHCLALLSIESELAERGLPIPSRRLETAR